MKFYLIEVAEATTISTRYRYRSLYNSSVGPWNYDKKEAIEDGKAHEAVIRLIHGIPDGNAECAYINQDIDTEEYEMTETWMKLPIADRPSLMGFKAGWDAAIKWSGSKYSAHTKVDCPECGGYGFVKRKNQAYGKSSVRRCPVCNKSGGKSGREEHAEEKKIIEKLRTVQEYLMSDEDRFLDAMNILSGITGLRFGMQADHGEPVPLNELGKLGRNAEGGQE